MPGQAAVVLCPPKSTTCREPHSGRTVASIPAVGEWIDGASKRCEHLLRVI
jgi:hypothetical protein